MDQKRIRLECFKLAVEMRKKQFALKVQDEELAEKFAEFCVDSEIHVEALALAVRSTHATSNPDGVIDAAKKYVGFAYKGSKTSAASEPKPQLRGRGRPRKN